MIQNNRFPDTQQPLALGSFRNWLKLLWHNRGVDRAYTRRALFVSLSSFFTAPFRLVERTKYSNVIKNVTVESPIFIVGHWRSGTTYLHYLMCQDKSLGYVSTFQAIAPDLFLVSNRLLRPLLSRLMPSSRIMDNIALSLDGPQEEEIGVANLSPFSFYHHLYFPRQAREYFKYTLFDDTPETVVAGWKQAYLTILRKGALNAAGKRLVIKNPVNTGRIKFLLDLFPDAKFIHIYRNPYRVFLSTCHLYEKVLPITQLQEISRDEIETNILLFYRQLVQRFLAEKSLIPTHNLVEVKFEDLEANPLAELRRIYAGLDLPGLSAAEPAFRAYAASQADYQKNKYDLDEAVVEKVNQHWGFAVEAWGYDPPRLFN
jgi:hypothetical protein